MPTDPNKPSVPWIDVFIFYLIAVITSAPFRLGWLHLDEKLSLPYGLNVLYKIFNGLGPAIGYFIIVFVFQSRVKRTNTFWGESKVRSFLSILIIPLCITLVGVNNELGLDNHYYGLINGIMFIAYAVGEEYGWRGYLQDALSPLREPIRVLVIACLWFIWHLNFLREGISPVVHLIHFLSLVAGAWGLLKITQQTHSILFAAAVHLSFNILSDFHAPVAVKLIILGTSIATWIVLLKRPMKKDPTTNKLR